MEHRRRGKLAHTQLQEPGFKEGLVLLRPVVVVVHLDVSNCMQILEEVFPELLMVLAVPHPKFLQDEGARIVC